MKHIIFRGLGSVWGFCLMTAQISADVFPGGVKNQCEFSWSVGGKSHVDGQFNVLIDLKDSEGELQERAYIYIDCKARADSGTTCMGVRIMGLEWKELGLTNVFPIRPQSVEIASKPGDPKLVLIWEGASTFEIVNRTSFVWTMNSKLTGKSHRGVVACK
jgi:hypothetical protein